MYCRGQLVQLQRDLAVFQQASLGVAAISYDSREVLHDFAARKHVTFPLLSDRDSNVIRAFDVQNRKFPRGTLLDVDTEQVTNSLGDVPVFGVAYPSVFLIDPQGMITWRFVSQTDELRFTASSILDRAISSVAPANEKLISRERLRLSTAQSDQTLGLGNRVVLGVKLKLPPGSHVYAPTVEDNYRPLDWSMAESQCWYQSDVSYPPADLQRFEFSEHPLPVFQGEIQLTREIVLKPVLSAKDPSLFTLFQKVCLDTNGQLHANGKVNLQVCDSRQCYPPQSIPLEWTFHFTGPDLERSPEPLRREFNQ